MPAKGNNLCKSIHPAIGLRNHLRVRAARTTAFLVGLSISATLLAGCNVGPKYVKPNFQAPPAFKESSPEQASDGSTWKQAAPGDAALSGKWWEIYHEAELNTLEEKLNTSNQNIAESFENFMAARAQVRQARSNYFPTVTTTPSYTRSRSSQNISGVSGSGGTSTGSGTSTTTTAVNPNANEFTLPFDVSWEPDLWGKFRNTVREYANAAQVSAADLDNERLTEQANLAVYYFELRGQDSLEDLYKQTVDADRKSLELTQTLVRTGVDDGQAEAEAKITLKNAEASLTNLGVERAQYEHAIALLIGASASTFSLPHKPLTTSVPAIPLGLPSELLQRRPDIAAAERTMSEANALIGVEKAVYYPSLTLSAEGGFESSKVSNWFTWPSRFFSVGPSASETLFDAGLRHNTVAQYTAQYRADEASYRQTVLTAFQQTEDYIASVRILGRQLEQQQEAVDAAQEYYNLAQTRYRTGVDPYLDVFTADTTLLSDQQTAISLRVQQMSGSIQLIEALGGGWTTTELPSEKSVASKKP
jgi:NodT family efflux transporter outer membrane factor (OMF) lipoprotein